MGFEYGSQAIQIRNPFRAEGAVYAVRGAVVLALGAYLLMGVQATVGNGDNTLGALQFVGGLLLVVIGLHALGAGLFKMFRFYVGRGVPANLAQSVSNAAGSAPGSAGAFRHPGIYDPPERLSEMLLGRKNLTFVEPQGWLSRLLHGFSFPLIFLPHAMRWTTLKAFMALWYALAFILLLGLAYFSGRTGLTAVTSTPVAAYLGVLTLAVVLVTWLRYQPQRNPLQNDLRNPRTYSSLETFRARPIKRLFALVLWIAVPILLTYALLQLHENSGLDPLPVSPFPWLAAYTAAMGVAFAYAFLLAVRRARHERAPTDVSEYRAHWQESVHPMDIFRAMDITLANHRYLEIPHRVYIHREPDLKRHGSENKGDFDGETLQEIQPEPLAHQLRDPLVFPGIVIGQLLLLGAAVWLFFALTAESVWTAETLTASVLGPLLLWMSGRSLSFSGNLYLGEIQFQSQLIAFRASGTYSESRLAIGNSIYDSTRSENVFIRSSLTPWLIVSRVRSSIIAVSGAMNLEQPRYVLEMEKSDGLCEELVREVRQYLRERQLTATVESEADLSAALTIHQMNEQTRAHRSEPVSGHPQISDEIRRERIGAQTDSE